MSYAIEVVAYAGYRGEQEPRAVVIDGERQSVKELTRRWLSPDGRYFEVELADGRQLVLREDDGDRGWSLIRLRDRG